MLTPDAWKKVVVEGKQKFIYVADTDYFEVDVWKTEDCQYCILNDGSAVVTNDNTSDEYDAKNVFLGERAATEFVRIAEEKKEKGKDVKAEEKTPGPDGYECFHCGHKTVYWDSDFDFQDYDEEGEGIIHECHCTNCGAQITYRVSLDGTDEDNRG